MKLSDPLLSRRRCHVDRSFPVRQDPAQAAVLGLGAGSDSVSTLLASNRGPEEEARAADEPLRALLVRLRGHFELIRAVRFAHEGE